MYLSINLKWVCHSITPLYHYDLLPEHFESRLGNSPSKE